MALTVVFQPLIVPSVVIVLLFYVIPESTSVPKDAKWSLLLLIMVTTLLIPMLSVIGMRMTTMIPSIHMVTKRERVLPFSMVSLFYLINYFFFYFKLNVDSLMVHTLAVITTCVVTLTIISFFWRISAHLTGLAGLLAIILVLKLKFSTISLLYPLIASVLLCGAVSSARLYLDAHKPFEVFGGFVLGFTVCFISLYLYLF
jgi:membrane-associated phospholipid phosphatase